jgi:hypothetical protein
MTKTLPVGRLCSVENETKARFFVTLHKKSDPANPVNVNDGRLHLICLSESCNIAETF